MREFKHKNECAKLLTYNIVNMLTVKIISALIMSLLIFSGCTKTYTLQNGMYVPSQSKERTELPYILIKDGRFTVVMDNAVSYQPSGDIMTDNNEVTLECIFRDETYRWVFELNDNNCLKLLLNRSALPGKRELWEEGMEFILAEQ